jgi:quercetin dioxygenase-like cupin family protein
MAIPHAKPGEVVDVRPLGEALATTATRVLVKTDDIEVIRLIVPAGREIPPHQAKGELIVQCLEGRVAFTALGETRTLEAGQLLFLPIGVMHSVRGIDAGSLLLTVQLPKDE